jgi:hypothetical protein
MYRLISKSEYVAFQTLYTITLLYKHIKENKPELKITYNSGASYALKNILLIERVLEGKYLVNEIKLYGEERSIFNKLLELKVKLKINVFGSNLFTLEISPARTHMRNDMPVTYDTIKCEFQMRAANFINYRNDEDFSDIFSKEYGIWGFGSSLEQTLYIDVRRRKDAVEFKKYTQARVKDIYKKIHDCLVEMVRFSCCSL